jgi:hypothetical protein
LQASFRVQRLPWGIVGQQEISDDSNAIESIMRMA